MATVIAFRAPLLLNLLPFTTLVASLVTIFKVLVSIYTLHADAIHRHIEVLQSQVNGPLDRVEVT
jgi:hypothetical protein